MKGHHISQEFIYNVNDTRGFFLYVCKKRYNFYKINYKRPKSRIKD